MDLFSPWIGWAAERYACPHAVEHPVAGLFLGQLRRCWGKEGDDHTGFP
jgi:hypothetical protein